MAIVRHGIRFYTVLALLLGPLIVTWFAGFGLGETWTGAWHAVFVLLHDTLTGKNLYQQYSGTTWANVYYTYRLILLAIAFAYGFGLLLTVIPIVFRWRPFLAVYEAISVFLESVPDTLYIIGTLLLMIFLLNRYHIDLPVVEVTAPTWYTTLIPAFVLSLPSIFYLKRLWSSQLQEESWARYVQTARAKGASQRRVLWRHIFPNLGPISLGQLPFVATMVISTSLFAEMLLEYRGQLFNFTVAVGFNMKNGEMTFPYHMGMAVVMGLMLVVLWWLIQFGTRIGQNALYPADLAASATPSHRQRQWGWIAVGALMVGIVLFGGTFPTLFTHFNPNYMALGGRGQPPLGMPLPPSKIHLLGTDTLGHDTFSDVLHGTYNSIYPALIITLCSVVIGTVVAVVIVVSRRQWLISLTRSATSCLSSIPALFILFLAMYHRTENLGLQFVQYTLWFVALESLRSSYPLYVMVESWFRFEFVEGAESIGRSRLSVLFSHLRPWLSSYLLEFPLATFVRVISIMTQLATLHVYVQSKIGLLPFNYDYSNNWPKGVVSAHFTWFGMVGDSAFDGLYFWDPVYLLAPILAIALISIGVNLITHGLRGGSKHQQSRILAS